ncbi:MAG: type II secretion system protein [SAR202 cluster bacterium]|nr:type II secretion system protein [SAR202 cluster bacterium]
MVQRLKRAVFNNQRGFTLLELLAVMSIMAVLAGIVTTSVSGTSEDSRDAQAIQDSTTVGSAAADYFSDQDGAEIITPEEVEVLSLFPNTTQEISTRWPEDFVTSVYRNVLPPDNATTVTDIAFLDSEGAILTAVVAETNEAINFTVPDLLTGFTAVDFNILIDQNYMSSVPDSYSQKSGLYANYLWLFEKADSAGSAGESVSRNVALFKLIVVQKLDAGTEHVSLVYQRVH